MWVGCVGLVGWFLLVVVVLGVVVGVFSRPTIHVDLRLVPTVVV